MRLGYLVGTYPAVSHTFIAREVEGLRELGFEVQTMSVRRPADDQLLTEEDRRQAADTLNIQPPDPRVVLRAQLYAIASRPFDWLRTLALALRLSPGGVRASLWHLFYFAEATIVWRWSRERAISHLHAHFANAATTVVLLAAELGRRDGLTWSFTMHGPTEFDDVTRFRVAEKVRRASFVPCISDFARSQLMKLVEESHWRKLRLVHCGIDTDAFSAVRRNQRDRPVTILCVGRLVPDKGQALLIRAVADLLDRGDDVRLELVGDGAQQEALVGLASSLGIAHAVEFKGAVGQDRIRHSYAAADIFCLPSFAEGVPVVLMEAMATELPVVTTRIMGIPELVDDGVSGLVIAPGRADALTAGLGKLVDDPAARIAMGKAGRAKICAEYRLEEQVARLAVLYRELGTG